MPPLVALITEPAEAEAVEQAKVWLNKMPSEAMRDTLRGLMDGPAAVLVARAVAARTHCGSAQHLPRSESVSAGEATTVAKRDEKFHSIGCIEDHPSHPLLQERTSASWEGDDASRTGSGAAASHTAVLGASAGVEENEMQAVPRTSEEHVAKAKSLKQQGEAQQLAASTENLSLPDAALPDAASAQPTRSNDIYTTSTAEDSMVKAESKLNTAPSISSNRDSSPDVLDQTLQPSRTEHSKTEEGSAAQPRQPGPVAQRAAKASMDDERLRQLLSSYHRGYTAKAREIRAALIDALASEGWQQRAKAGSGQGVIWGCAGGSYYFPPGVTRENGALSRSSLEKDCAVPAGKRAYYQSLGGVVRYLRQISWHGWTAAYHAARSFSDEETREIEEESGRMGCAPGCDQQQTRPSSPDEQLCQLLRDYSDGRAANSPGGLDVRRKLWAALESEGWRKEERHPTGTGGRQILYFPPGVTKLNGRWMATPPKQAIDLTSSQYYFQNLSAVVWYLRSTNWHGCTRGKEFAGRKRQRRENQQYQVGDRVSVKFSKPNGWFNGSVSHDLGGSRYRIDFDDGESWDINARKRSVLFEHARKAKGTHDEKAAVDLPSSDFVVSLVHECLICSTEFGEKELDSVVCQLDCGHPFCAECITTWFESADMNTCPHCRRLFKTGLRTCPRATVAAIRARQTHIDATGSGTADGEQPAARPLDCGSWRTWTEEEDREVLRMVDQLGPGDWHSKATQLGTGRSGGATYHRWRKLGGDPNEPKGTKRPRAIAHTHWTEQEDTTVVRLVRQHGTADWESIAKELGTQCPPGRATSAIQKRWQTVLAPLNPDMPCSSTCDECGSSHNGTFGPGRFCNRSCSHAHSIRLKMERFYRERAATADSTSSFADKSVSSDESSEEEHEAEERPRPKRLAWTVEEDRKLTQLVHTEGANDWSSKAARLGTGRSGGSVSIRWSRLQRKAAVSASPPGKEQETEPIILSLAWKAEQDDATEEYEDKRRSSANIEQPTVTVATWYYT